jgi:ankyrin repeat protein
MIRSNNLNNVRALIAGGSTVRLKNKNGSTPLHLAVQNTGRGGSGSPESKAHQIEIIKILLKHGANSTDKDNNGKTVLECINEESIRTFFQSNEL